MQIVAQPAPFSYSFSPFPALCAPRIAGLLPAPTIAGLLAAPITTARIEIEEPPTLADLLRQFGPIRSLEEMDAEIDAMAQTALQSLRERRAAKGRRS